MQRTQIYLDSGQAAALDARAKAAGRTRSDLIREAVDTYLGRRATKKTAKDLYDYLVSRPPAELRGFEESRKAMWRGYEASLDRKFAKREPKRK